MATTNYYTLDGMLIGESTGGVNRAYGLDALGSVVATYTGTAIENAYVYKPYGGTLAKTGTAADPSFLWNGGSGYRATKLTSSEFYVRARFLSSQTTRWTTADPQWPFQPAYGYVSGAPVRLTDSSGLAYDPCCCVPISVTPKLLGTYHNKVNNTTEWGWEVLWTLVYGLDYNPSARGGMCDLDWSEVLTGTNFTIKKDYKGFSEFKCVQTVPCGPNADPIVRCTFTDWPYSLQPDPYFGTPWRYEVDVTITMSQSPNCGGVSVVGKWSECEEWSAASNDGKPSPCKIGSCKQTIQ